MNRERPSDDRPPEDPPDWFDAGGTQDADASTTEGGDESDEGDRSDGHDGVRAGEWFDGLDHRPIETVPESTDGPTDSSPAANGATDDEGNATDVPGVTDDEGTGLDTTSGTAGTTEEPPNRADEASERAGPASADPVHDGVGPDESGPAPDETGSEASEPKPGAGEGGPEGDGSEAVTAPSRPDESGRSAADADDPARRVDTDSVEDGANGTDAEDAEDAEDTGATASVVGRVLAWLRSIVGRLT